MEEIRTVPRMSCTDCPIRHNAVCARCETDELMELEGMKSYRSYKAGEEVVWAGDQLTMLGSVVSGYAALNQTLEDGRRQVVGLLLPSDFIGRPDRSTVPYDVVAVTDLLVCQFDRSAFCDLLKRSPPISQRLLEMTLDELDAAREWMTLLGRKTARERIASFFAMLLRRTLNDKEQRVTEGITLSLPLTRGELGDYLGLTLETTSRQISTLKKDGIIVPQAGRTIYIPDIPALLAQTGIDADGDGGLPS